MPLAPRKNSDKSNRSKRLPVSRSERADTLFPVGRLARLMKEGRYSERISLCSSAYMAAVLEYVAAEILEFSGICCQESGRKIITPKHLNLGVRSDEELTKLMSSVTIHQGGQRENILDALQPKKK
jgi:histone H2A